MNRCTERVYNGLVKENPTFVLMLGMCPTLAVTTSAINGLGMGLSTTVVLVLSLSLIHILLDLDALTGGFNLQIAWSTAYAAGSSIE